jgi:hypothetical protein
MSWPRLLRHLQFAGPAAVLSHSRRRNVLGPPPQPSHSISFACAVGGMTRLGLPPQLHPHIHLACAVGGMTRLGLPPQLHPHIHLACAVGGMTRLGLPPQLHPHIHLACAVGGMTRLGLPPQLSFTNRLCLCCWRLDPAWSATTVVPTWPLSLPHVPPWRHCRPSPHCHPARPERSIGRIHAERMQVGVGWVLSLRAHTCGHGVMF